AMRRVPLYVFAASVVFATAAVAQDPAPLQPPAQQPTGRGRGGGGRGGRGNAMAPGDTACPAGQTEIRPRTCMAPEFAPPSILDYRPRTTLVADAHMVKTSKYPSIDYHGHPGQLIFSQQGLDSLGRALDALNVRMMVSADNLSGERLKNAIAAVKASAKMHDRVRILAGIDFRKVGRHSFEDRRSRSRSDLGSMCETQTAGVHPHGGSERVLQADRLQQRALARARALPGPQISAGSLPELRGTLARARQHVQEAPQDHVRRGAHGVDRGRPEEAREDDGRDAEREHGSGRRAVRHRAPAAQHARLLREVSGPDPVRKG